MRRYTILLVCCLVLSLTGCGVSGSVTANVPVAAEMEQLGLMLSSDALPGELEELTAMEWEDGAACLAGADAEGVPVLGLLDASGCFTAAELPRDVEMVRAVSLTGGEAKAIAEAEIGFCLLSVTYGSTTKCKTLSAGLSGKLGEVRGCAEAGGALYVLSVGRITKLNADGELANEALLPAEGYPRSILACGGKVYILMDAHLEGAAVYELDPQTLEAVPLELGELYPRALGRTSDGMLCIGVREGEREYVIIPDGGVSELFDWAEPGILVPGYSLLFGDKTGGWLLFADGMTGLDHISPIANDSRVEFTMHTNRLTHELAALVNDFNTGNSTSKLTVEYQPRDAQA